MSYNKITIIGNLGRDPELRYTQQGKAICSFSVATTEKWTGRDGQQEKTIWFKVNVWGKQGENANKYLSKGRPVYVEGNQAIDWVGLPVPRTEGRSEKLLARASSKVKVESHAILLLR